MPNPIVNSRLLLRLSSLGDVILASSALEALPPAEKVDWATTKGYSELLRSHSRVARVFEFDRQTRFRGWVEFSRQAWDRHYQEILDLHGNLRTLIMRMLFLYWGLRQPEHRPKWKKVSKQRFRLYGYFIFKNLWPRIFHPTPWVERFTQLAGGTGKERPNLRHLLEQESLPPDVIQFTQFRQLEQFRAPLCIMPASKWDGKKWPAEKYVRLLKTLPYFPIVLGSETDAESKLLCKLLTDAQIPYLSGVGQWNLAQTACVLAASEGYLGSDTGLAHLAEAVGVPARIIFGPTTPAMGFAPWKSGSLSIGKSIGCRPCGKDGRYCFRVLNRYSCLKDLSAETVLEQLEINEN